MPDAVVLSLVGSVHATPLLLPYSIDVVVGLVRLLLSVVANQHAPAAGVRSSADVSVMCDT